MVSTGIWVFGMRVEGVTSSLIKVKEKINAEPKLALAA